MTPNQNSTQLQEAESKVIEARKAIASAKTKKALNEAHFELEFWTSKAAFFMYAKG